MTVLHETADCDRVRNVARLARLARMSPNKSKPVVIEIMEYVGPEPIAVERKVVEPVPVPADYEKNNQPKSSRVVDSGFKREPLLAPVPSLDFIKRVVARAYGLSVIDIESSRRTQPIVRPRQIVCYLSATMTRRSLPAIGRALGDRDHTTILHARDKIARLRAIDPVLDMKLEGLKAIILDTFLGVPS